MKLQATVGLLSAICISCVIAYPEDESDTVGNKQCDRSVPLMPWRKSYRVRCTYLCRGWPFFRHGNEPDGIACGVIQPIIGRRKVCMAGECVPEHEFKNRRRYQRKLRTTRRVPTSKEGVTRYEPTSPKEYTTTNLPKTTPGTSQKHYSTSEGIFRTTSATDIEVSATTAPPAITTMPATTTASATETPLTTQTHKARELSTRHIDRSVSKAITDTISLTTQTPLTTQAHNIGDGSTISTTNIDRAGPKTTSTTTSSVSETTLTTQEEKAAEISTANIGRDVPQTVTATTSSSSETTLTTRAHKVGEVFTASVRPDRKNGTIATAHSFPIERNESTTQSIA